MYYGYVNLTYIQNCKTRFLACKSLNEEKLSGESIVNSEIIKRHSQIKQLINDILLSWREKYMITFNEEKQANASCVNLLLLKMKCYLTAETIRKTTTNKLTGPLTNIIHMLQMMLAARRTYAVKRHIVGCCVSSLLQTMLHIYKVSLNYTT